MKEKSKLIRTQAARTSNKEHSVPLYLTSSFVFDNAEHGRAMFADEVEGNIYSRYSNPNTTEFIDKVRDFEGAAYGDLDNDGDLDYVVNNINDPASIFRNNAVAGTPDDDRGDRGQEKNNEKRTAGHHNQNLTVKYSCKIFSRF